MSVFFFFLCTDFGHFVPKRDARFWTDFGPRKNNFTFSETLTEVKSFTCFTHFLFVCTCFTHFLFCITCFTHFLLSYTCFTHLLFPYTCSKHLFHFKGFSLKRGGGGGSFRTWLFLQFASESKVENLYYKNCWAVSLV